MQYNLNQTKMTNQRTKILDCIDECRLDEMQSYTNSALARMYTDDLVDVIIAEFYLLREQYDELLEKANNDSKHLLDKIETLKQNKQ